MAQPMTHGNAMNEVRPKVSAAIIMCRIKRTDLQLPPRRQLAACGLVLIIAAVLDLVLLQQLLNIPALAVTGRLRCRSLVGVRTDQGSQPRPVHRFDRVGYVHQAA